MPGQAATPPPWAEKAGKGGGERQRAGLTDGGGQCPARMASLWDLTLALFFFCWEAGMAENSTGLSTSSSVPLVTTNNTEVPALTHKVRPSSEAAFQTTDFSGYSALSHDPLETQTLSPKTTSKTLILTRTISEVDSRDAQTTSPVRETKKTQTTCPSASTLETQATFLETVTLEPQITSSAMEAKKTQITFPATETIELQTTSPETSTLEIETTSFKALTMDTWTPFSAASSLDSQTTSPAASTLETQTASPEVSVVEIQTTSPAASTLETQTASPEVSVTEIQTTSPAASTKNTQPPFFATSILETHAAFPEASTMKSQTTCPSASSQTTSPEASTLDTQATFSVPPALESQTPSATKTRTLPKIIPSNLGVTYTALVETSATSSSPGQTGVSAAETDTVSDPIETIFDSLCADDSSEEARKITIDLLTMAHTSTEAESLSSERSSSSDSLVGVLTGSQALTPDVATPAKDLVAFSITHIEVTSCITEIKTSSIISGTSNTDHSPTEVTALSTSETSALSNSTEPEPNMPKTTASTETLSTTSTSESVTLVTTLEATLPTSGIKERETTVPKTPTPIGSLVTISRNPLEETSAFSIETQNHTEVLGTTTVPTVAGSTVGEVTSFTASLVSVNISSAVAATKNSTPSETFTTGNTTNSSFPIGGSPFPFVYSTTANTSKQTNTRASPKPPVMPPTPAATVAWTKKTTKAATGQDGGFLLVRLSVESPEDLTETRVVERLMHQLHCELHIHMPLAQVSLLRIRRG